MPKLYDSIPKPLARWMGEQKVFWVATAPLSENGLVNLSPKGVDGTFHYVDENTVWYEDLTGSGSETIAHVKENGRITVLFNAFEGPPMILRLYGKATVHEFGTPEYHMYIPAEKRTSGSRAVILIDVFKIATSCGFGVPFFTYKAPRNKLLATERLVERADIGGHQNSVENPNYGELTAEENSLIQKGMKNWWRTQNAYSLDGLPALESAFDSDVPFRLPKEELEKDDESIGSWLPETVTRVAFCSSGTASRSSDLKFVVGFLVGAFVATSFTRLMRAH